MFSNATNWMTKRSVSWALYDFADQAFAVLFLTLFLPLLVKVHYGGTELSIGLTIGISLLIAAMLAPFIGAYSDATRRRNIIVGVSVVVTVLAILGTAYLSLIPALIAAGIASASQRIAKDIYNAKMTEVTKPQYYGFLSGFGFALGYTGSIAALLVAFVLLQINGWENLAGIQAVFLQSAVWLIVFSLPMLLFSPDLKVKTVGNMQAVYKRSLQDLKKTVKRLPERVALLRFFIASFFYGNAMNTIIIFLGLFGSQNIGLSLKELFPALGLMALTSAIGALGAGKISDLLGPITVLRSVLLAWLAVVLIMIQIETYVGFLVVGGLGGVLFGAVWVLGRHAISVIAGKEEIAKLYSLSGIAEKLAGVVGPIVFGLLATVSGYTAALISVLVFFSLGFMILPRTFEKE